MIVICIVYQHITYPYIKIHQQTATLLITLFRLTGIEYILVIAERHEYLFSGLDIPSFQVTLPATISVGIPITYML